MRLRPVVVILAAVTLAPAQNPAADNYRKAHDALFAAFLPVPELSSDPSMSALLTAARDGIWRAAQQNPQFRQLLTPFTDLTSLETICQAGANDAPGTSHAYADMTPSRRERVLKALETCQNNDARRLAFNVRSFYEGKGEKNGTAGESGTYRGAGGCYKLFARWRHW